MELYFPVILDGATGTQLQKRGYDGSICAEQWVLENPEALKDFQERYLDAGTNILYAPTFGANRIRLEENGISDVEGYNERLVALSKELAQGRAYVAGDIAPTGKFLPPVGDTTFEEMVDVYKEQVRGLEKGGADLYVIETMMSIPEARAAVLAVRAYTDKPIFVSFTCTTNGKTLSGEDMVTALITLQSMGITAFGLNCSVGPEDMCRQLKRLSEFAEIPLIAKPNAGLPDFADGKAVYKCTPEEYTRPMEALAAAGVAIFGGCCGSTEEHIRAISEKAASLTMKKPSPSHTDKLHVTTGRDYFLLDPAAPLGKILPVNEDLMDELEAAMDQADPVISIRLTSEAELSVLEECQHAINKPLCLVTEDAALLEKALRLYQGRALYEGSLSPEVLKPLKKAYGLIL